MCWVYISGNITDLVGEYCGNTAPTNARTADSKAYLKFTSDAVSSFPGFSLNFYASIESKYVIIYKET